MDNKEKTYLAPEEDISPARKAKESWGLQAAQYIVHNQNNGLNAFYNARADYAQFTSYYMGEQDKEKYMPVIRINPKNAEKTDLLKIRQDIKNHATNIINIVVSKMDSLKYDPVADPIDPLAIDKQKEFKARIAAFLENQSFLQDIGVSIQGMGMQQGVPEELMPTNVTDIDVYMQMNYKLRESVKIEKQIREVLRKNKFTEMIDRLVEKDLAIKGVGCVYTGLDQNNDVVIEYVDPSDIMIPFSKTGDFSKVPYIAHRKWMSIQDLKSLNKTLDKEALDEIEKKYATSSQHQSHFSDDNSSYGEYNRNYQDTPKVEVIVYEYKTINELVYLKKKDKGGNVRIHEKDYEYFNTIAKAKEFKEKFGDDREIIRKKYQAIYTGVHILGTNFVMNHELKNNIETPNGPFGATVFGYKIFAPNFYNGKIVSLMKQMIPILDDLQEYSLKIREHLSQPFPDGIMLDLFALRKASSTFEWGGKEMKVQDILEMAYQNKIILFDSSDGKYAAGSNYKPIFNLGDGSKEIAKYLQLISQSLMEMERITGLNQITLAGSLPKEAGKRVTEMQAQASDVALDYLYDSKRYLYSEVYKSIGTLYLQKVKFGDGKGDINRDVTKYTYDFKAEARPTQYDWSEFYQELTNQKTQGLLSASDIAMIRQIDNLKEAYAYLAAVEFKRRKQESESKQQDIELNAKAQQQSNLQAHQNKITEIETKNQRDLQVKSLEIQIEKLRHKNELEKIKEEQSVKLQTRLAEIEKQGMIDSKLIEEKLEDERMIKLEVEKMKLSKESKSESN